MGKEDNDLKVEKAKFSGKLGFVLSAAGAAVGLGNIWRFPYLCARYGGGIFLLVYFGLAVTFGFSLLVCEIAIGRKTGKSAVSAFGALDKRFSFLGYGAIIIPLLILPYYSVVGGWVIKYVFSYIFSSAEVIARDGYFAEYIESAGEGVAWLSLFLLLTLLIVVSGVQKGIEKMSKIIMPVLLFFMIFVAIYTVFTLDGAPAGVLYYLKPDFSKLSLMTVVSAMGQLFYSMSLALGVMITYGSYLKKEISIEKAARHIELFDTGIAFLAGLMIIPCVYAFSGGEAGLKESGKGLMFVTLPKVFETMNGGRVVGFLFFAGVFFAAITSAVSIMETIVSSISEKWHISRIRSCILVASICALLGILPSFGYSILKNVRIFGFDILDFFDFLSNNIVIPLVALGTCILVGYVTGVKDIGEEISLVGNFKRKKMFSAVIKYIAPICIVLILLTSFLEVAGLIVI